MHTHQINPLLQPLLQPDTMAAMLRAALPQYTQVDWVDETGSTNADLLARARSAQAGARPWLLGTHLQQRGRGRLGRTWRNHRGANLMFSCAFDVFLPPHRLPALAPLTGMVTCQTLRTFLDPDLCHRLTMKWPNDVLWDRAKLAGILIESTRAGTTRATDHHVIVIGLGLNLEDTRALSTALNRPIADWAEMAAADLEARCARPDQLVTALAGAWYAMLNEVTAHGLANLPDRYRQTDALNGQMLDILDGGRLVQTGVACGIDAAGRLLVRNPAGVHPISVGEVSVRARP